MNASPKRPLPPAAEDKTMTIKHPRDVVRKLFPPETSPLPDNLQQLMDRLKAADHNK